jgi:predicted dehydrogenase
MIGGGLDSNIGETHRLAARLDNRYELVAGAFSSNPEKSRAAAQRFGVPRTYNNWLEMLRQEAQRDDGAEVVSILTPNHLHFEMALAALEHGFDVICDKPLTNALDEALKLYKTAKEHGLVFGLTHNCSGYPMVRHARHMVKTGELGELRLVQVEHASGWAATLLEAEGHKQASWRTTPEFAGQSSVVGDLGTHAHQLARFVTGLEVCKVSAELMTVVPGRQADDNAHIKLHFENGVKGTMWVSMAATGHEHGLRIRVYGSKASLEWQHEDPNHLLVRHLDAPPQRLGRGSSYLSDAAKRSSRIGAGHAEGFFEAFANIYTDVADAIVERRYGIKADPLAFDFPNVADGVKGVKFIEASVLSSKNKGSWTEVGISLWI